MVDFIVLSIIKFTVHYYPAPYGSYAELTTTSNTYLATEGGNVGIGTTTPGAKLDVAGNARVAGTLTVGTSSPIKLEYKNCQLIDGGRASRPNWSVATCPAGSYVAGFHFLKSRNTEEDTEYRVTSTTVESRRVNDGTWAQSWAECCNFYLVTPIIDP